MSTEIAARVSARDAKSPMDAIAPWMLPLVLNVYPMFYMSIAGSYATNEDTIDPTFMSFLMESYATEVRTLSPERLRNTVLIRAGDGKKPFFVGWEITITNYAATARTTLEAIYGKGKRPIPLTDLLDKIRSSVVNEQIAKEMNSRVDAYVANNEKPNNHVFYKDILSVTVTAEYSASTVGDEYFDVKFTLGMEFSPTVYPKLVDSDSYSAFMLQMGIRNCLSSGKARAAIVIDPRKTSSLTKMYTSKYGLPKPRVNSDGFAIYASGIPILIPKDVDATSELVRAGDAAVDENGFYNPDVLVEKGFTNRIIYVDWLNDVLAYTTSTGEFRVLSLIGVSELTKDLEFSFLETKVSDSRLVPFFNTINQTLADVEPEKISQYVDPAYRDKIPLFTAAEAYLRIVKGNSGDLTLSNLCGWDIAPVIEENPTVGAALITYRAYVKYLSEQRNKTGMALAIPSNYASQGIRFRLIGLEYIIYAVATKREENIRELAKAFQEEHMKKQTVPGVHEFELPNVKIGPNGMQGLLPHQGRIYTSMQKMPRLAMLPVQTGGGKTVLSFLDALTLVQKFPGKRPVITTKGSLVKGTVTEINRMSQGGINAIPLRAGILRRMKKGAYGIDTFEKLLKWVRDLPPNTVFINAYSDNGSRSKIYKELPSIPGIGTKSILDSQYLRIMRIIGFHMNIADESHMIKNPTSKRSVGTYSAMCAVEYRRDMSGTINPNTVRDLVGQAFSLSPAIFGEDPDAFCDRFGIQKGIIKDDATAQTLKQHLMSFAAYHQATRDQWSFMLPDKSDEVVPVKMTDKQTKFYDDLMNEAFLTLTGKKPMEEDPEAGDDDDEEDEDKDEDDEEDEEEAKEEAFIEMAKQVFSVVERFVSAPDMNEQYIAQLDKPTGDDLVSPKVAAADRIIDTVLARNLDPAKNKVIVFGINLDVVKHFAKHSRYGKEALVYFAGDEEVLRKYKTDPTKRVLIAAETSIREGENLQMTSAIIKLQIPWAPGDYEQALARMFRPDPRGVYSRDNVEHYAFIATKPNGGTTLDTCKMARLISKTISNARFTYESDPRWLRRSVEFGALDLIRMNLAFIFETKPQDLQPYFGSWGSFVDFENDINRQERTTLARTLEASSGEKLLDANGRVTDVQKFIKLAMYDVKPAPVIPGSKTVYVPWVLGGLPPDPDNFGFSILGSQQVYEGDVVWTEFGPGIVRGIAPRTLKVETYGGKITGFRRGMICTVPEANKPRLQAIIKDGKKWQAYTRDPQGKVGVTTLRTNTTTPAQLKEVEPAPKKTATPKEKKPSVDVNTAIVNGMPALSIVSDQSDDLDKLLKLGWNYVDPYVYLKFRTWAALQNFMAQLEEKAYIPPKVLNALDAEIEEFKQGTLPKLIRTITQSKVRQFFIDQRKRFGKKDGKYVVNPYIVAIDDEVRVAFDKDSHDPKVIQWLHNKVKTFPGVQAVREVNGVYLHIFKDISEARKHMSELVGVIAFDESDLSKELTYLRDDLKALMSARKRPM